MRETRPAPPFVLPRALIFLASVWLIGSWLLAIGLVPPVHPSSVSYEHGLQMMLLCVTIGLVIGWPLLRLSQVPTSVPLRLVLLDIVVMVSMLQVVLWPLRLVTAWSVARTFAIDLNLIAWLLVTAAVVAAAIGTGERGPRHLAMLGCIAICLLGPLLGALVSGEAQSSALVRFSPLVSVRALSAGGARAVGFETWATTGVLLAAGAAAWAGLVVHAAARLARRDVTPLSVANPSLWPVAIVVTEFVIKLVFISIILYRPPRTTSLAWITIIFAVPILGVGAYLLVGQSRLGRRRIRRHAAIRARLEDPARADPVMLAARWPDISDRFRHLATLAESVGDAAPIGGNRLQLIGDTDLFIESLVTDIENAAEHCHLLFYIFLDDSSGHRVGKALAAAAARGIACRLLVDAVGSREFLRSELRRSIERAGVQVVAALPANVLRFIFARLDLRNHRKIAVIDGRIAYMGSHNIADAAFAIKPRFAPWVDAMVRARGPIAHDLQLLFVEDWYLDTDEPLEMFLTEQPPSDPDGVVAQIMSTGPNSRNEAMRQLTLAAFHAAREELILTTPYFVPDDATASALASAARRGVETSLVVPARNDSPLVAAASRSHYEPLLDAGVRIFEFGEGLLHAKTLTLDRSLALITTANLDRRSFELNFEVSMVVYDSDFASQMRFLQTSYIERSRAVDLGRWRRRAVPIRLLQNAAGLLGPVL